MPMKKTAIILALAISGAATHNLRAEGSPSKQEAALELCSTYNTLARDMMERRQNGAELAQMVKFVVPLVEGIKASADADLKDTYARAGDNIMLILKAAYEIPRYHTENVKQYAITEYANDVYLRCIKQIVR